MPILIWTGTGIALLGLIGLVLSIVKVASARRANLSDDEMREAVRKAMPLNMGGLFVAVIGLMAVIVGVFLG
ncbi:hypothetical protein VK792_03700 [Mesobacterium sp. TK19101]|uniref:Uncharacterized protein n=1 Tax=Mesobacterium hydrothermale TaxID=3111907 RepID=A0ABU6HD41_9RHOB|nr:hypothetical protein [Mesobacterium sp. TK19101]MEC3860377.1 hypothetical protein [Mesobacterium sp. TK19101]